ncbi:MAG: hypothetical protein LUH40_05065 [Clostridiales bacterium]|nr:hypothetical protein [Clostridiales bacterium]
MNFPYDGKWHKWAPYGFDKDGHQRITEYYPNALESTYKDVSGYIYSAEEIVDSHFPLQIPDAVACNKPVKVSGTEFIPDAYKAILQAERENLISITRYCELSDKSRNWLKETIKREYETASDCPDYRFFLRSVFPDIFDNITLCTE